MRRSDGGRRQCLYLRSRANVHVCRLGQTVAGIRSWRQISTSWQRRTYWWNLVLPCCSASLQERVGQLFLTCNGCGRYLPKKVIYFLIEFHPPWTDNRWTEP